MKFTKRKGKVFDVAAERGLASGINRGARAAIAFSSTRVGASVMLAAWKQVERDRRTAKVRQEGGRSEACRAAPTSCDLFGHPTCLAGKAGDGVDGDSACGTFETSGAKVR